MKSSLKKRCGWLLCFAVLTGSTRVPAAPMSEAVRGLTVDYQAHPLGTDNARPDFGWSLAAPGMVRGIVQRAYRIVVRTDNGPRVWDSGKVLSDRSQDIPYLGDRLRPETRYHWAVTVWDNRENVATGRSWFETALMSGKNRAGWSGADWIGGTDAERPLYSDYLSVFKLAYTLRIAPGSRQAGIVFAANDPRLMNRKLNQLQIQDRWDQSYFEVALDISGLSRPGGAAFINIYRAGYYRSDRAERPFARLEVRSDIISVRNEYAAHRFVIRALLGALSITLDGRRHFYVPGRADAAQVRRAPADYPAHTLIINLNPLGLGGNYTTFGMLCDLGFAAPKGQLAFFSNLTVADVRAPGNILFQEDLYRAPYRGIFRKFVNERGSGLRIGHDSYVVNGGRSGVLLVANPSRNAMPMLRTVFALEPKRVKSARLYATARGIYEMYLNGRRVGDEFLNPGFSQYNLTQYYQTFDVTKLVKTGRNALGAMMGEGWWSGLLNSSTVWNHFGDRESLLAKLVVTYRDGSRQVIVTQPGRWRYFAHGPVVYASLYMGEVYDAMRAGRVRGWSKATYDDRAWQPAVRVPLKGTTYSEIGPPDSDAAEGFNFKRLRTIAEIGPPARVFRVLTARGVTEIGKGIFVYDMGQNMVGVPRIAFREGSAGRRLVFRYAEVLYPHLPQYGAKGGTLMTDNYRAALSEDEYTMKAGAQVFEPRFTYRGYRYIEVSGLHSPLPLSAVQGIVISSITRLSASYQTSSPKVNRLWRNIVWSNLGNFVTIPTDCPQRNERLGWSGDLSVFARTATYISNTDAFLHRQLRAMRDLQAADGRFADIAPLGGGIGGVLWGSAGITVPWQLYQQYGDLEALRQQYAAMGAYIDYLQSTIDLKTGLSSDDMLGDWLGPQYNQLGPAFLATAYHIYDLGIMAQVATLLGRKSDAERYSSLYRARKAFFNRTFVSRGEQALGWVGGPVRYPPRPGTAEFKVADVESAYAVGVALGAFNARNAPFLARDLMAAVARPERDDSGVLRPKYSLMTGFIGTAWISDALSEIGRADLAYRMLQTQTYPSWLYPIDQGATTIWERLDGYTLKNGFGGHNSMNSFNHYSFGSVGQWMMSYSIGIQRGSPGFQDFVLQPEPDPTGRMTWAKGHYDSPFGRIESSWRIDDGLLIYIATVPPNCHAVLYLPTTSAATVRESGRSITEDSGVALLRYLNGKAVYRLGSGRYRFTARE